MEAVWIVLSVMVSAVLITNLGLGDAIAEVSGKILKCPLCLSFWASLVVLLWHGENIIVAVALSILASYLSNYFGLLMAVLNKLYTRLWQKTEKLKCPRNPPNRVQRPSRPG